MFLFSFRIAEDIEILVNVCHVMVNSYLMVLVVIAGVVYCYIQRLLMVTATLPNFGDAGKMCFYPEKE